jgi:uncharacterized membrane protein
MGLNVTAVAWRFDPYPFILLNLVFSAQAAYAAPLILFAQYRQSDRDRISLGEDRDRAERIHADTDFLARELAALRIAIGEAITRNYLRAVNCNGLATRCPPRPAPNPDRTISTAQAGRDDRLSTRVCR